MITRINQANYQKPYFKPTNISPNRTYDINTTGLFGDRNSKAAFYVHNINFKNLSVPINVTDKYNNHIPEIRSFVPQNIQVYEYPDTNLQVFIDTCNYNENTKDKIVMELCIKNNDTNGASPIKDELCTRLLCNLINTDDDCMLTTINYDFFRIKMDFKSNNYKKISSINNIITNPVFTEKDFSTVKQELIQDIKSKNTKKKDAQINVINEIANINLKEINDYYNQKLKNSEAQLFITTNQNLYNNHKQFLHKTINESINKKFQQHTGNNKLKTLYSPNTNLQIFDAPDSNCYMELQYPIPIDNEKQRKIAEYISQLVFIYSYPYVTQESYLIDIKPDSEILSIIDNKPTLPYLRFKFQPQNPEKTISTEEAIDSFKYIISNVFYKPFLKNTLKDLKELDKNNLKEILGNNNLYTRNSFLSKYSYDVFNLYKIIDSVSIEDVKKTIEEYILNQEPIIYINEDKTKRSE